MIVGCFCDVLFFCGRCLWEKYNEFAEYIKMVEHQVKVITRPPVLQAIIPSSPPDAFNQFVDIGPAMLIKLETYLLRLMPEYQGHKPAYLLLSPIQLVQLESPSLAQYTTSAIQASLKSRKHHQIRVGRRTVRLTLAMLSMWWACPDHSRSTTAN